MSHVISISERIPGFSHLKESAQAILKSLRPLEWLKNLFVFSPLFFSGEVTVIGNVGKVFLVFLSFSALSSAVYLFNDLNDREHDRNHPVKRYRPIASGQLSPTLAIASIGVLTALSFILVISLPVVWGALLAYGFLNVLYTLWLKNVIILDVFSIAIGFVLRVSAGGSVVGLAPSSWLITNTFLLSLVLGLGKRRYEVLTMKKAAGSHRSVLDEYTVDVVDSLISVVTPLTVFTYLLYTLDETTVARFDAPRLYLTTIFVVFGIFRYLYLVHRRDLIGSPTELIVHDGPLALVIIGWVIAFVSIVYF
jgi:4-hydroxybenzoate polyprenyltransferase